MPPYSESLLLLISTVVGLFCLCPLFTINNENIASVDSNVIPLVEALLDNRAASWASLFIVVIPIIDLLLDLPSHIESYFFGGGNHSKKCPDSLVVVRLSDIERFLFIIGVAAQSAAAFLPATTNVETLALVHRCTYNFSLLMVLSPVETFLGRCTSTFSHSLVSIVILTSSAAFFITTLSYYLEAGSSNRYALTLVGLLLLSVVGILNFGTACLCFYKYLWDGAKLSLIFQQCHIKSLMKLLKGNSYMMNTDVVLPNLKKSELYTHFIPGLHMVSVLIIGFAHDYAPETQQNITYQERHYVTLFAQVMVLVIELRIRKNEIARGLIALLDSKKSYVRHISHELRTPLNTAFLGLKLLTGEMKASKDPRDIERYDTLCDVNMSCMAAVDILNDLLCYEKLDSGILELHKEDVIVLPFITQCVSMFSVQAKECGVKMFVLPAAANVDFRTEGSLDQEPLTIEPYDSIHVDKFKMDQVIRNLVSNALKFTPRGGTVTVQASFIHDSLLPKLPRSDLVRRSSVILNDGCASIFNYFKEKFPLRRRSNRVASEHESDVGPNNSAISLTGKLVVVVVDSGAGISIENQKRLFKDIVQFNPEKLQAGGGSGLGLWITKGIVDLHGGNISVNSMGEGMGSSFTVEIPMVRPMHLESLENNSPVIETDSLRMSRPVSPIRIAQTGLSSPAKFPTPTPLWDVVSTTIGSSTSNTRLPIFDVLVVDDSRLNRKMLLKCLTKDGHICTEAEDGLEAIERVKERIDFSNGGHGKPYDAILMDFVMPNMDGPTATKQLRTMGYTGAIFGVTGNGLPSDIKYFLDCGANDVLLKPLDVEAFGLAMKVITNGASQC